MQAGLETARRFVPPSANRPSRDGWWPRLEPFVDERLGLDLVEYELAVT